MYFIANSVPGVLILLNEPQADEKDNFVLLTWSIVSIQFLYFMDFHSLFDLKVNKSRIAIPSRGKKLVLQYVLSLTLPKR